MTGIVARSNYASSGSPKEKNWFAVFTVPRNEKRVAEHFRVREIESFLPLIRVQRQWKDGTKPVLQLPLFPCYLFARIGCDGRVPVLEVPGVISIVGGVRRSLPVPDSYINFLREGLLKNKIQPYPYLTVGTRVRIRAGALAGLEGVLACDKSNLRVVLTLEMIMKSVTVEVAREDIEPVGRATPAPYLSSRSAPDSEVSCHQPAYTT